MSPSYQSLICFPIDKVPSTDIMSLPCLMLYVAQVIFLQMICGVHQYFCVFQSCLFRDFEVEAEKQSKRFELSKQRQAESIGEIEDGSMSREETEMVMAELGILCHPEGGKLQEKLVSDNFWKLFEENEPSLEEVKEAFDVFDENRDGFIDARELQRVLCVLGFGVGSDIDNCRRMIKARDANGDGRIDFHEFLKFMENI